jgi:ubiquinol-cytochrome c reductase cytochrome b subunit
MLLFTSAEDEVVRAPYFDVIYRTFFWGFIVDWIILTYIGGCPAEEPYITIGWITTFNYFLSWFLLSTLNYSPN